MRSYYLGSVFSMLSTKPKGDVEAYRELWARWSGRRYFDLMSQIREDRELLPEILQAYGLGHLFYRLDPKTDVRAVGEIVFGREFPFTFGKEVANLSIMLPETDLDIPEILVCVTGLAYLTAQKRNQFWELAVYAQPGIMLPMGKNWAVVSSGKSGEGVQYRITCQEEELIAAFTTFDFSARVGIVDSAFNKEATIDLRLAFLRSLDSFYHNVDADEIRMLLAARGVIGFNHHSLFGPDLRGLLFRGMGFSEEEILTVH